MGGRRRGRGCDRCSTEAGWDAGAEAADAAAVSSRCQVARRVSCSDLVLVWPADQVLLQGCVIPGTDIADSAMKQGKRSCRRRLHQLKGDSAARDGAVARVWVWLCVQVCVSGARGGEVCGKKATGYRESLSRCFTSHDGTNPQIYPLTYRRLLDPRTKVQLGTWTLVLGSGTNAETWTVRIHQCCAQIELERNSIWGYKRE